MRNSLRSKDPLRLAIATYTGKKRGDRPAKHGPRKELEKYYSQNFAIQNNLATLHFGRGPLILVRLQAPQCHV